MENEMSEVKNWKTSRQLRGYRANLVRAINGCTDGAEITLDIEAAKKLVEIIDQAIHTEVGHGV